MNKKDINEALGEIYHYTCSKCGQANLSRDEIHARDHEYICLKCLSNVVDKGGIDEEI